MSFEPLHFLDLANELLEAKQNYTEARGRTAISRAYYAVFLTIHQKLAQTGTKFQDVGRIHRDVILETTKRNSHIGNRLKTLYDARIDADYKVRATIKQGFCGQCLKLAETILQGGKNL